MSDFDFEYEERKPGRKGRFLAIIALVLVAAVAGGLFTQYLLPRLGGGNRQDDAIYGQPDDNDRKVLDDPVPTEAPKGTGEDIDITGGDQPEVTSGNIPDIVEAVSPAVVGVINSVYSVNRYNQKGSLIDQGSGSGVIIDENGYIVTNNHVIDGAKALRVVLSDGTEVEAELVGRDRYTDLAVLKVEADNLTAIAIGDSDKVRVGELAIAIGSPLGIELGGTVTHGIISSVNRQITVDGLNFTMLQTDAPINPGNSGGALVNGSGELIGINSTKSVFAGYTEYGDMISAEGIGFAIPTNVAKPIIEDLIKYGQVRRPVIGITGETVTQAMSEYYEVPQGFGITDVQKNGPADRAGIKAGDVVIAIDGEKVASFEDLYNNIMKHNIGDEVTLKIYREGDEIEVIIVLISSTDMSSN